MLQTRSAKRTGFAAVRIAVDMVEERIISKKEALLRVEADHLNQLLRPIFDDKDKEMVSKQGRILAKGLPAGPGAATGRIVFHAEDAVAWKEGGEKVVLCRTETSPDDIRGMEAAQGILTARGGMTSHAALVARRRVASLRHELYEAHRLIDGLHRRFPDARPRRVAGSHTDCSR